MIKINPNKYIDEDSIIKIEKTGVQTNLSNGEDLNLYEITLCKGGVTTIEQINSDEYQILMGRDNSKEDIQLQELLKIKRIMSRIDKNLDFDQVFKQVSQETKEQIFANFTYNQIKKCYNKDRWTLEDIHEDDDTAWYALKDGSEIISEDFKSAREIAFFPQGMMRLFKIVRQCDLMFYYINGESMIFDTVIEDNIMGKKFACNHKDIKIFR